MHADCTAADCLCLCCCYHSRDCSPPHNQSDAGTWCCVAVCSAWQRTQAACRWCQWHRRLMHSQQATQYQDKLITVACCAFSSPNRSCYTPLPAHLCPLCHHFHTGACWQVLEDPGHQCSLNIALRVGSTECCKVAEAQPGEPPAPRHTVKKCNDGHTSNNCCLAK